MLTECSQGMYDTVPGAWSDASLWLDDYWMFVAYSLNIHWVFTGHWMFILNVHWVSTVCSDWVFILNVWCVLCVYRVFTNCSLSVRWMFPGCSLNVYRVCMTQYLVHEASLWLDDYWMFTEYLLNIYWVFTLNVHIECLLAVTEII